MALHLRVFSDAFDDDTQAAPPEPTVRVSLNDLLPILTVAKRHNYLWLQDFLEDEVCITSDLYEVLRAFNTTRQKPA